MTHLNNHHIIREVIRWQENAFDGKFPNPTPQGLALKLLEEVIELAFASGANYTQIQEVVRTEIDKAHQRGYAYPKGPEKAEMRIEMGDVIVSLTCFGLYTDTPGIEAAEDCLERIASREWAPDKDGVLRRPDRFKSSVHIDEGSTS